MNVFQFNMVTFDDMSWCGQSDSESKQINPMQIRIIVWCADTAILKDTNEKDIFCSVNMTVIGTDGSGRFHHTYLRIRERATERISDWKLSATSALALFKWHKSWKEMWQFDYEHMTKKTMLLLVLAISGTTALIYFIQWQRRRYQTAKKRIRKNENRGYNIQLLKKRLSQKCKVCAYM